MFSICLIKQSVRSAKISLNDFLNLASGVFSSFSI